jgi:folate-binding protein YgfZ
VLAFLHNLITTEVEHLMVGQVAYGALLSPQGKIQHELFIHNQGQSVFIDCVRSQREDLIKKLTLYRLRAKITIEADDDHAVIANPEPNAQSADPRMPELGSRGLGEREVPASNDDYRAHCLSLGITDGEADIGQNVHFPHEANLDLLHGVSFTKGCYVGQEVVSRMQHRGTARSRMLPVACDAPAPPKGTAIKAGDDVVGSLLSAQGRRAMALVRLDRLAEAKAPLLSAGVSIHVHKPAWMTVDFNIPGIAA